jgi:hypothetical protein
MDLPSSHGSDQPRPVFGLLSLVLGPLVVLVTFFFTSLIAGSLEPNWFSEYPQYFMQYFWLAFLAASLVTSVASLLKREQPRWVFMSGVVLTVSMLTFLTLFLGWLED